VPELTQDDQRVGRVPPPNPALRERPDLGVLRRIPLHGADDVQGGDADPEDDGHDDLDSLLSGTTAPD
jgi:hypothetical protein